MFTAARCYLDGRIGLVELHGFVAGCRHAAKFFSAHPAIAELAGEWSHMLNRAWNEWGFDRNAISETEFRDWLRKQMDGD